MSSRSNRKRKLNLNDDSSSMVNPKKKRKVSQQENAMKAVPVDREEKKDEPIAVKCTTCKRNVPEHTIMDCCECGEEQGCKDECCFDHGFYCSQCKEFWCYQCCPGDSICDACMEIYCWECSDFKPGKNGTVQCASCQPSWKKNKPASAFCSGCGSSRINAQFCVSCCERYCEECPLFECVECGEMQCEGCNDMQVCDQCCASFCDGCGHQCDDD